MRDEISLLVCTCHAEMDPWLRRARRAESFAISAAFLDRLQLVTDGTMTLHAPGPLTALPVPAEKCIVFSTVLSLIE